MSDFHLRADLPADATDEQVDQIRADAFKAALTHAATDPGIRAKMILGETAKEIGDVYDRLLAKLAKEPEAVQRLVREMPFASMLPPLRRDDGDGR